MADYKNYGLLIDYKFCDNCGSCVVSCQTSKDLAPGEYGIQVFEKGPYKKADFKIDDGWDWDFIPVPTEKCDLCADRLDAGKKPLCVKHCLTFCMEVGPIEELAKRALELGEKVAIYKPM